MSRRPTYNDLKPRFEIVTEEEAYEAKVFVDENHDAVGKALADAEYLEWMVSVVEAEGINLSSEKSADKRKADARTSQLFLKKLQEWRDARAKAIALNGRYKMAAQKIEIWRTVEATRRARETAEHDSRMRWGNQDGRDNQHQDHRNERRSDDEDYRW